MSDVDPDAVAVAVAGIRERIRRVAGERPVELIAVTKGFGVDAIQAAVAAGCTSVGENYAQELRDKAALLPEGFARPQVHFIGQLQSNKVRLIAPLVNVWQSIDRAALADEVARRAPQATVFVQVNTTDEAGKGGCEPASTAALVTHCAALGLSVVGLMTVGPTSADPGQTRVAFRCLRSAADDLGLAWCSMGMSADLEIALEEGATHIRIGSALFGQRPQRRAQMG
ncbi:unannotated protein [freshwater metagenome]|uniref:Unannotated protein n=1 Tax=freshwater metagenome TaxID=449393 RepID=A0A6J7FE26_9ZZZZ